MFVSLGLIEIGIIVTMIATITTLLLQVLEFWNNKKLIKQGEIKLEQENERLKIQRQDVNTKMIAEFLPSFKEIVERSIEKPEEMGEFYKKIMKLSSKMKDIYKPEEKE